MTLDISYLSFRNNWNTKINSYKHLKESSIHKIKIIEPNFYNNYFPDRYLLRNPFTKGLESVHAEEYRDNWLKSGKQSGPGVVKFKNPDKDNEYSIFIPCYAIVYDKENISYYCLKKQDGDKVVNLYTKDQYINLCSLFGEVAVYPAKLKIKKSAHKTKVVALKKDSGPLVIQGQALK